jgi:hypothetical protein
MWFLAALTRLASAERTLSWARAGVAVGLVCLVYAGMGLLWLPVNPLPADAYRYVAEIEKEFNGIPADKVLLDFGAWIKARDGIIMRDAAPGIGSRGASRVQADFSGLLGRLSDRFYEKVLVHNLDAPEFPYDNRSGWWSQPTGIREVLRENYREVGRIKAVAGEKRFMMLSFEPVPWTAVRNGFQEITILVPRQTTGTGKSNRP